MSVQKIEEIYFINDYGNKFATEEEAINDETKRNYCPWKLKFPNGDTTHYEGEGFYCLDDTKSPWTAATKDGKSYVRLYKNIIEVYKKAIEKYGENVGYTEHHCGNGTYCKEMIIVIPNESKV